MKPPSDRAAHLLTRLLVNITVTPPVGALKDGESAGAPNPQDDPMAYARHVREQHALRDYVAGRLAKLLSGRLTAKERESWGRGVDTFLTEAFFEPFFRGQENRREALARGPITRGKPNKHADIIAEWRRLERQGTRERDRAGIIAGKLKLGDHYVRHVVAPIKAAELKRAVALRILKKSEPRRFE